MPLTAACTESYAFAKAHGLLIDTRQELPKRGDLFYWMTAPGISHHTGVVLANHHDDPTLPADHVRIDAGNAGPVNDQGVHESLMPIDGHEFARWTRMACKPRASAAA